MSKAICYILLIISISHYIPSAAQIKIYPLPTQKEKIVIKLNGMAREQADSILNLPFWDDFSFSKNKPADSLWLPSGVFINDGFAQNPPTIGVASFDGIDNNGRPYSVNAQNTGASDNLTSRIIDLSGLTVNDNVYISFFYQYAGNGEIPDAGDSIRLEARNNEGQWISTWPGSSGAIRDENFNQAVVKLNKPGFFHDAFQFRFQTFGRQSGAFDVWNVDYVYVNKNRSTSLADTSYPDRAISTPPKRLFKNYQAIPIDHFNFEDLDNTTFSIYSLDNPGDVSQTYNYGLTVEISNYKDSVQSMVLRSEPSLGAGRIAPREFDTLPLVNIIEDGDIPVDADSSFIHTETILRANDNSAVDSDYIPEIYAPIDFRSNDTVRVSYTLSDYYAYDDGSAEVGAGLNFSGDIIATRFDLLNDTTDNLVALDLYFPYLNAESAGKGIQIMIWDHADSIPGKLLYRQAFSIQGNGDLNSFQRYALSSSVAVSDTFYIGYRQNTNGELGIGLDKNNDSGDKIYYNLDGTWQQNTVIKGSLMMRPVFGEFKSLETAVPREQNLMIKVYPNPSPGSYQVSGEFTSLLLTDIRGVARPYKFNRLNRDNSYLNIENLADGMYILHFIKDNKVQTIKVIKQF